MATLGLPWVVLISGILHCNILQGNAHRIIANNQLTGAEHAEGYVDVTVGTGASLNAKFVSHPEATPSVENVTHATNGVMIAAQRLKDSMGKPDRMEDLRKTITCNEFVHELLVGDEDIWTENKLKDLVKRVGDIDCHKPDLSPTPLYLCIHAQRYALAAKLVNLGADPLRIVLIGGHWTRASVFETALLDNNPVTSYRVRDDFHTFSQAIKDSIDRKLEASPSPQRTREEFLVWNFPASAEWSGPYWHASGTPYWHKTRTGESSWTQPAAASEQDGLEGTWVYENENGEFSLKVVDPQHCSFKGGFDGGEGTGLLSQDGEWYEGPISIGSRPFGFIRIKRSTGKVLSNFRANTASPWGPDITSFLKGKEISTYRRFKQRVGAWSFFHHAPALTKDDTDKLPLFRHDAVRNLWKKAFDKKWWKGTVGK
mmetsp:Transcript_48502/g.89032  ORF Transcript_48502/g.89032 Transcript_48502/m.89032 type:complete len:428 (+) Transcript_48502:81-1364(+)